MSVKIKLFEATVTGISEDHGNRYVDFEYKGHSCSSLPYEGRLGTNYFSGKLITVLARTTRNERSRYPGPVQAYAAKLTETGEIISDQELETLIKEVTPEDFARAVDLFIG